MATLPDIWTGSKKRQINAKCSLSFSETSSLAFCSKFEDFGYKPSPQLNTRNIEFDIIYVDRDKIKHYIYIYFVIQPLQDKTLTEEKKL